MQAPTRVAVVSSKISMAFGVLVMVAPEVAVRSTA